MGAYKKACVTLARLTIRAVITHACRGWNTARMQEGSHPQNPSRRCPPPTQLYTVTLSVCSPAFRTRMHNSRRCVEIWYTDDSTRRLSLEWKQLKACRRMSSARERGSLLARPLTANIEVRGTAWLPSKLITDYTHTSRRNNDKQLIVSIRTRDDKKILGCW